MDECDWDLLIVFIGTLLFLVSIGALSASQLCAIHNKSISKNQRDKVCKHFCGTDGVESIKEDRKGRYWCTCNTFEQKEVF